MSDAELWVVGPHRLPSDALVRAAPPGTRFVARFVTDPELPAYFRRADLVVMPYRAIEASGVLFTALAFGRPILASAVGGSLDVGEMGAAELVPAGDAQALRAAIVRLLADDAARERLAAGARAAAAGPYSWHAIAERTAALYRRLVGGA